MENQPTALQIAADVRAGSLTAREAATAALARIEESQQRTNAWQVIRTHRALAEADAVDQRADLAMLPLAGVPIAIKDNVPVEGEPMTDGSAGADPAPQAADHEIVRRLRAAGAVVVGITRVPELCLWGATDTATNGITRNPWALDRTPGGSSGGSAAAVAAGDVPLAHGNDGMGSIRIPSACCGLVGLKPGLGVVPADIGLNSWNDMAENGPLATTVGDAALMFSVLAGDPTYAEIADPGRLRIAVSTKAPAKGAPVSKDWAAGVERTADALRAGHDVASRTPRYPASLVPLTGLALWTTGARDDASLLADQAAIERRTQRHIALGRFLERLGHPKAQLREAWRARAEEFFADTDVLMTPSLAQPPIKSKDWNAGGWLASILANARYAPFAAPWNIIGWPAMSVPAGLDREGRPVGVQLVGRPGSERVLLGLAAQIEQLQPWQRTAARPD